MAALIVILLDWVPEERRGTVSGLMGMTNQVATVSGTFLIATTGTQGLGMFIVPAAIGLVLVTVFALYLKEAPGERARCRPGRGSTSPAACGSTPSATATSPGRSSAGQRLAVRPAPAPQGLHRGGVRAVRHRHGRHRGLLHADRLHRGHRRSRASDRGPAGPRGLRPHEGVKESAAAPSRRARSRGPRARRRSCGIASGHSRSHGAAARTDRQRTRSGCSLASRSEVRLPACGSAPVDTRSHQRSATSSFACGSLSHWPRRPSIRWGYR